MYYSAEYVMCFFCGSVYVFFLYSVFCRRTTTHQLKHTCTQQPFMTYIYKCMDHRSSRHTRTMTHQVIAFVIHVRNCLKTEKFEAKRKYTRHDWFECGGPYLAERIGSQTHTCVSLLVWYFFYETHVLFMTVDHNCGLIESHVCDHHYLFAVCLITFMHVRGVTLTTVNNS